MRQEREINRRVRELGISVSANELSPTVIAVQLAYPQLRAVTSAFACLAGEDNNEKRNDNDERRLAAEIVALAKKLVPAPDAGRRKESKGNADNQQMALVATELLKRNANRGGSKNGGNGAAAISVPVLLFSLVDSKIDIAYAQ